MKNTKKNLTSIMAYSRANAFWKALIAAETTSSATGLEDMKTILKGLTDEEAIEMNVRACSRSGRELVRALLPKFDVTCGVLATHEKDMQKVSQHSGMVHLTNAELSLRKLGRFAAEED